MHRFIALMEHHGKLLRNYTQNIDTLEQQAGISAVVPCHGSFATASCLRCGHKVPADSIRAPVMASRVPLCRRPVAAKPAAAAAAAAAASSCVPTRRSARAKRPRKVDTGWRAPPQGSDGMCQGLLKPDITFFGEKIDNTVVKHLQRDRKLADCLLVIGTSLKVTASVAFSMCHVGPSQTIIGAGRRWLPCLTSWPGCPWASHKSPSTRRWSCQSPHYPQVCCCTTCNAL